MSLMVSDNSLYLKNPETNEFLPVSIFNSGADKSMEKIAEFAEATKSEAEAVMTAKKTEISEGFREQLESQVNGVISDSKVSAEAAIEAKKNEVLGEIPDSYTELQDSVNQVKDDFAEIITPYESRNLFNLDDERCVSGKYPDGSNWVTSASTFTTHPILLKAGKTYITKMASGIYGITGAKKAHKTDENGNLLGTSTITGAANDDNTLAVYTVTEDTWVRFKLSKIGSGTSMVIEGSEYPSEYIPYFKPYKQLSPNVQIPDESLSAIHINEGQINFIVSSAKNLCDKDAFVTGILKEDGSVNSTNENWVSSDYIPVQQGNTYALYVFAGISYGSAFKGIPCYNSNRNFLSNIIPEEGLNPNLYKGTITIPTGAAYIRTSYMKTYTNAKNWRYLVVTQGTSADLTGLYIPYRTGKMLAGIGVDDTISNRYNPLFGKTAIWNGDSICAADGDPEGGWGQRIAKANGMRVKNYGVSGGTISENVQGVYHISEGVDTMLFEHPDADYIIIEGGANDADRTDESPIGTFDASDFSDEYISGLDRTTFSGALESIFHRLITLTRKAHIGYLIPQKMGYTEALVARRYEYFTRAIAIAKKWGVPVLNLWDDCYLNWRLPNHWDRNKTAAENEEVGNYYLDGQHITSHGYEVEAHRIAEWMKTI